MELILTKIIILVFLFTEGLMAIIVIFLFAKWVLPCLRSEGSKVFQLKITLIHKFFHKRIFIKFYIKLWLCSGIKCISAIKFFVYVSSRVILLGFALLEWIWWIYKVLLESKIFYAAQSPFSRFFFFKIVKGFSTIRVSPSVRLYETVRSFR